MTSVGTPDGAETARDGRAASSRALVVVDAALASVGRREVMQRVEAIDLLRAVMGAAAEAGPTSEVALIVDDLAGASGDAVLVGTPRVTDTLLDIRLAVAGST
jgi:hypothetical protein